MEEKSVFAVLADLMEELININEVNWTYVICGLVVVILFLGLCSLGEIL